MKSQEFFISGTFVVPGGVSALMVTMIGGGAGSGSGTTGGGFPNGSGAGGGGECVQRFSIHAPPGSSIAVVIGAAGTGGDLVNGFGGAGGVTSTDFIRCMGGWGGSRWDVAGQHTGALDGTTATAAQGGIGGGPKPGRGGFQGTITDRTGQIGNKASPSHFGGAGGGCGGDDSVGGDGGPSPGMTGAAGGAFNAPASDGGGGGGGNAIYGPGSAGATGNFVGSSPASNAYGAGAGGGGAQKIGAAGRQGYVLIQWMG